MSQIQSTRNLLKGAQAEFVRCQIADAADPGVEPFGTSVLVLMDQCAEMTTGKVLLPPEKIAQMNIASETGVVVDIGEAAFRYYDDGSKWNGRKPVIGERVFVERYAGREILGRDGRTYRLMTYTCVAGREKPVKTRKKKG